MTAIPENFVGDLCALLEIPGVAVWDEKKSELERAAEWLRARLQRAGMRATLLGDTPGPAYVYAETEQRPDRPTILLYGHYDVQPASRSDGWTTDPFSPDLRQGRIYARGATDQKMNLLLPIFALEECLASDLAWNLKVFFEGEEEIFSPNLEAALNRHADLLRCDVVFSTDGWQASGEQGDLRLGLRGFCGLDISVAGASKDLHSGTFGGAVPNPAQALARALSRLLDDSGAIAVPGFMDGIILPTEEERRLLVAQPLDRDAWLSRAGLAELALADGISIEKRTGLSPAIEINAIEAGYHAKGFRSIVPGSARAHVSCRLVPGQDPDEIAASVRAYLDDAIPRHFGRRIEIMPGQARPYRMSRGNRFQQIAFDILRTIDRVPPRYSYSGGSIPMLGAIKEALGVETVIFGFGLPDENMHGVDEFCRVSDIQRGMAAWRLLFNGELSMAR